MENCEKYSKLLCSECEHYDYCDIAKRCDGICYSCDITECKTIRITRRIRNETYSFQRQRIETHFH